MFATTPSSLFPLLTFSIFRFFLLFTISLRLSLAVRDAAGRVRVRLRAIRYRGGNGGGCRSRGCGRRRRVRARGALLLLGVLQIARIQQRRKISRLIHPADGDAAPGAMLPLILRVLCVSRRRDITRGRRPTSHHDVD